MELKIIKIDKPNDMNMIMGHAHFIKTVEDLHETMIMAAPSAQFGIGFCEASQDALVRWSGNNEELVELARKNAMNLGAGHTFIIFMEGIFPINVLNAIKNVPEVARIYCATGNPVEVILAETEQGRGVLGVIDGIHTKGIETDQDIHERKKLLRKFGYKL